MGGQLGRSVIWALIVIVVWFVTRVSTVFEQCQFNKPSFNPELEVRRYGKPTPFVFTKSIGLSPYSLTDPFRQTALYHEYLLIGPGIAGSEEDSHLNEDQIEAGEGEEEIQLILYDEEAIHTWDEPNIVEQNLGKEYFWALINATGMLPSLTIVNTTFEKSFRFHTDEGNEVAYHLPYPNLLRSQETLPPTDVIIEFPAKTKMFQSLKIMIDYQTFGLLRWKLTPSETVPWNKLRLRNYEPPELFENPDLCRLPPDPPPLLSDPAYLRCLYNKRMKVLENPCIKDMFILYKVFGEKGVPGDDSSFLAVNRLMISIPMVYDLLYFGWIDLTEAYCPVPDNEEECTDPLDIVLTNDHLVILTENAIFVSNSLNSSNVNASYPYSMKPLMKWTPIDPCIQLDYFNCSEVGGAVLVQQTVKRQRLFYTPVCHLFQYPLYDDMLILVIEHVTQNEEMTHERDVLTIMYSPKPYDNWKMLFHAKHEYMARDGPLAISELIGIFFNHHARHFDISLKLLDTKNGSATPRQIRFVLPLPTDPKFTGYPELNGLLGDGFVEFIFPNEFYLTQVLVHPEPLDVFFVGNQIWIAEAGGQFPYVGVPSVSNDNYKESEIESCTFNHPDRTFFCYEKTHQVLYPMRIGITYTSASVVFSEVEELRYTMIHSIWPFSYRQYAASLGNYMVGYSGKLMLWYLHDHNDLTTTQKRLVSRKPPGTTCNNPAEIGGEPVKCHLCKALLMRVDKYGCIISDITDPNYSPQYRMLAIDSSKLRSRVASATGPLVPFILDGDRMLLFEVDIPPLEDYKPVRDYFLPADQGSLIYCPKEESSSSPTGLPIPLPARPWDVTCASMVKDTPETNCNLYIRHMKSLQRLEKNVFLPGFRQVLSSSVIQSFPMTPIPVDLVIVVFPNSNDVIIQLDTKMFDSLQNAYTFRYSDVGQTLFLPSHFSIFLIGFPEFQDCARTGGVLLHDMTRMVGIATRHFRHGVRLQLKPFEAFLMDMATPDYCEWYDRVLEKLNTTACSKTPYPSDLVSEQYRQRRFEMDTARKEKHMEREGITQAVNVYHQAAYRSQGGTLGLLFEQLNVLDPPTYQEVEENLAETPEAELAVGSIQTIYRFHLNRTYNPDLANPQIFRNGTDKCKKTAWRIRNGGCQLRLELANNPVLKQNGGRISLDKFDSISFQVKLSPVTAVGRSIIHRPLFAVTSTNPKILIVEKSQSTRRGYQIMNLTLTPTGIGSGVTTVSIRPLIVSTECPFADGSFSLIVQVHRAPGRRLHVNYPIPICKPTLNDAGYERPWKIDLPSCVSRKELLDSQEIRRPDDDTGQVFYSQLPANYRPPSLRGPKIPLSQVFYNVHPGKPSFNQIYRISRETGQLQQCRNKKHRKDCECSSNDELSDDFAFTDCKRIVYTAKRGFRVDISVEYDRIMRDQDQHVAHFIPKLNWSVFLEEVNDRKEFTLSSKTSPYLDLINNRSELSQGRPHYDFKTLGVTLHGTGLFHFKVTLGSFESFDEVSGYFIIFIPNDKLNHVQLIIVMLLTITICMAFVFCGFLLVRRRLSSQLPFQVRIDEKKKLE